MQPRNQDGLYELRLAVPFGFFYVKTPGDRAAHDDAVGALSLDFQENTGHGVKPWTVNYKCWVDGEKVPITPLVSFKMGVEKTWVNQ